MRKQNKPKKKQVIPTRRVTGRQVRKTVETVKRQMNRYAKKQVDRGYTGPVFIPENAIKVPKIVQSEQFRIGFAAQLIRSGIISKESFRLQLQKSCSPSQFKQLWNNLEAILTHKRK